MWLVYQDYLGYLTEKFCKRSHRTHGVAAKMMLQDLGETQFSLLPSKTNSGLEIFSAGGGQIEFLLKENPDHKILHSVQVERNGFIEALLSGTHQEGQSYGYLGEQAYTNWIQ